MSEGVGRVGVECGNQCVAQKSKRKSIDHYVLEGLEIDDTDVAGYGDPEKLKNWAKEGNED